MKINTAMFRLRLRLWPFLIIVVNGLLLLAFVGLGTYLATKLTALQKETVLNHTRVVSQRIAVATIDNLTRSSYDQIELELQRQVLLGQILEVIVADATGHIVAHVRRRDKEQTVTLYESIGQPLYTDESRVNNDSNYALLLPIDSGIRLGWVRVTVDLEELRSVKRTIWQYTLLACVMAMLTMTLTLTFMLRKITRPIEDAAAFAGNLSTQGDTPQRFYADSFIKEIVQLGKALNQASRTLSEKFSALRDSESRKSAILQSTLNSLIAIDDEERLVEWNPAAEQMFGWHHDEVIGTVMSDLIVPHRLRSAHQHGMQRYLDTGKANVLSKNIELSALRRDGTEFPIELVITPFEMSGKQYFLGAVQEITERKALEKERQIADATQRRLIAELEAKQFAIDQHAIVSISDLEGTIIYANEKLQQISGYTHEELIGQNHRIFNSGIQDQSFYRNLWQTISSGQVWHGEYVNRAKNGQIYWVFATIVPIKGPDGVLREYISIQTDVSHQKRTEQKLVTSQKDLIELVDQYREAEIEIARTQTREMAAGAQIQRTLLFGKLPSRHDRISIATYTQPSQGIDGDFYEFFHCGTPRFDIILGDVMGKGITAALMGAAVKKQLNRGVAWLLAQCQDAGRLPIPMDIVSDLHTRVGQELLELESFVTLSYLSIDLADKQVHLVDAGHLPIIHVGQQGASLLRGDNLPLGVLADETYQQFSYPIEAGDLLFMYSDGLTEARNSSREEFGIERLMQLVQTLHTAQLPPALIVQSVRWRLREFEGHVPLQDDRTCIALQIDPNDVESISVREFELPRALNKLGQLRAEIDAAGPKAGLDSSQTQALILAAFETATNVVRHTPSLIGDATLHCRLTTSQHGLAFDLHYLGMPFDPPNRQPDFSGESEGGFGLFIIRNSVDAVRYSSPVHGVCKIHLFKASQRTAP